MVTMTSSTQWFGPRDMLQYDARFSVLICRECQYAIQKSAIQSHLLRHKIYRKERRELLESIADLPLLEPEEVPVPPPTSEPIDSLPTLPGLRCSAAVCGSLCASDKRMRRHWSEVHGRSELPADASSFFEPVKLQTFFRGTKIRYFEVCPRLENDAVDEEMGGVTVSGGSISADLESSFSLDLSNHQTTSGEELAIEPTVDLDVLNHFHHFVNITSLTLPHTTLQFWQSDIVALALRHRWLMCGLLSITALHSRALSDDLDGTRGTEYAAQYCVQFFRGWEISSTVEPEENTMMAAGQVQCLLRCMQWASPGLQLEQRTSLGVRLDEIALPEIQLQRTTSTMLPDIMTSIRTMAVHSKIFAHTGVSEALDFNTEACLHILGRPDVSTDLSLGSALHADKDLAIFHRLEALPQLMAEVLGRPKAIQDVSATLAAIAMLRDCCTISFSVQQLEESWRAMLYWAFKVSEHFIHMVATDEPAALVVMAYWAASLVQRAERCGCWFLRGLPESIVAEVSKRFPSDKPAISELIGSLLD